ncbi:MAG TPA: Na+/H+ antiporter subunit B, partial [Vitreimonas sp.]|nr:Na+/H+ antiporter subunit B [Vitreimonas sp.]
MTSVILGTTARLIVPVLLLFSIFLLLRGHNEPGGGFAGGLVAAAGFILVAIARDPGTARRILAVDPPQLVGLGILVAVVAGATAKVLGYPLLTGMWIELTLPGGTVVDLGTPILFDVGVYLVVLGTTLAIVLALI